MNHQTQPRQAQIGLRFIVVGGSIAGLGAAFALRRAGHNVIVVEKSDGQTESSGGIRSPPNMTKILQSWGLGPALARISERCTMVNMKNGCTGDHIGSVAVDESILDNLLADLVFLRHDDLHSTLYGAAVDAGAQFLFNSEVVNVVQDGAAVVLKGGGFFQGDVVVVADGSDSVVRALTMGENEFMAGDENNLFVSFQVSTDKLIADHELVALTAASSWTIWFGDDYTVNGNILGAHDDVFTMSIVRKSFNGHLKNPDEWKFRTVEDLGLRSLNLEPRLSKLLTFAKNITGRVHRARPPVESLVSEHGRFVLVGEAGHPLPPISHHSVALAIEDAQTLGMLFSRIFRMDQIPQMLSAYEEIRHPRIAIALKYEREAQARMFVPNGSEPMTMRDTTMRSALAAEDPGALDEETFKMVWGNELDLVNHDASEKVDDWWNQWGVVFECKEKSKRPTSVQVLVSRGDGFPNEIVYQ